MKTYFLVEADTDMYGLSACEMTKLKDGTFDRGKEMVYEVNRPQFFGNLSALLPGKVDAAPMELLPATVTK